MHHATGAWLADSAQLKHLGDFMVTLIHHLGKSLAATY